MKKTVLSLIVLASLNAQAVDVVLTQNKALVQDSGLLSESGFKIEKEGKIVNIDDVLETNIPDTFYFKIDDQNANSIYYDRTAASNPFDNKYAFYTMLKDKIGEKVVYKDDENEMEVEIFNVTNESLFLKSKDGIFVGKIENIHFSKNFFDKKNFNLQAFFNKEVKEQSFYKYFYAASGFNWTPQYTLTMRENDTLDFSFYANIQNQTKTNLKDINLTLMANDQQPPMHNSRTLMKSKGAMMEMAAMSFDEGGVSDFNGVSAANVEDLTAYKINGKVSLNSQITSNILVKEFDGLKYEKQNTFNISHIDHYNIKRNAFENLKSVGINSTNLFISYKDNKSLTKDYLPSGTLRVLKAENGQKDSLLLPYLETTFSGKMKEDFEINIPLNKNVKAIDVIKSTKLMSKKGVKMNYKIIHEQYFENNSSRDEMFITYLNKNEMKEGFKISADYKVDYLKNKGVYKVSTVLKAGEKKSLFMETSKTFHENVN